MARHVARAVSLFVVFFAATTAYAAEWQAGVFYALGAQVTYQGPTYECITAHTSQVGWEPNVATSLWKLASGSPTPTPTTAPTTPPGDITPPASGVTASTQDSNVASNTVDNNLSTRWSGNGNGAWVRFDLGSTHLVGAIGVAIYQGNGRRNQFDLQLSSDGTNWTTVFAGQSSGTTTAEQTYDVVPDQPARYVRYLGHGATLNAGGSSTWNSVTEVSILAGTSSGPTATPTPTATATPITPGPTPTPTPTNGPTVTPTPCCSGTPVEVTPGAASVTASANDGNVPGNAVDGSLSTRWSANGDGQWIAFDLGSTRAIKHVTVGFYSGNTRQTRFDIQVSSDGMTWSNVLTGAVSSGTTTQEQLFDVTDADARWVRYLGHGNSANSWNSLLEVSIFAAPNGSTPSPSPTPTPTPTMPSVTPTPTPTIPSGGGGIPARVTAPYIDVGEWPTFSMTDAASATGNKYYTLAFFQDGGGCTPKWAGVIPLSDNFYADQIGSLRSSGGDVIISFGGQAGLELAQGCSSVSALQGAYQSVLSHYNFRAIDLDIEGAAIADTVANDRRNKALRGLQGSNPGLRVSYTLPVMPEGLTQDGLNLLSNAKANGLRVDVVNVMAMDYGPCIDMGQAAIDAARNTNAQMGQIGLTTKIGVTPMIGVNDVSCETFKLDDGDQLLTYAQANSFVSELAFWSMNRDNGTCAGSGSANNKCSGLSQSLYAFTNKLKAFR
jgi:hypothetical protein